jgi:hypothetical protein
MDGVKMHQHFGSRTVCYEMHGKVDLTQGAHLMPSEAALLGKDLRLCTQLFSGATGTRATGTKLASVVHGIMLSMRKQT